MSDEPDHVVELSNAGSYHGWHCSCGATSRHLLPHYLALRNARAHERKGNRQPTTKGPTT